MKIPIKNIYYLLCYAWDKLDEGKKIEVSASDYEESINLFSRVLLNGCNRLVKKGLDRNYIPITEEYIGIKGKVDFKESINRNLFKQGKSVCSFDSFDSNILQNQLIKATFLRLLRMQNVDASIKKQIRSFIRILSNVKSIKIDLSLFSQVKIHRNNSVYDLLLNICKLICENSVLNEGSGDYHFTDFTGSDKTMATLFETFIRNFYKKEQITFEVRREDIEWDAHPIREASKRYLPKMQTDISLESSNRKIIIDTKYYANALNSRYDTEKFKSENLYQLFSYLKNIEIKPDHPLNATCEGILLYPTVDHVLDESYQAGNHIIRIKTLNLNTSWRNIEKELLDI